ncbi:TRAP transporter small permease [Ammoniphilus resinae]|uniref:TRAP-type C4-dicarboxylate transport system permease small subunit n=1 Tax=Ammoniphilus resinae TaxID=861532 RepID=A0ABS4GRL2_9BACL|nr:TRAP transporter small permease [Ammoniphilus resinae]MBP1932662.1 TRAP-type C4-dicarboxylate transport system permease small subunit [Ammoniphilus resinae]
MSQNQMDSIVSPLDRNMKWKSFDILERILMILCGICISGFTLGVFLDVLTRTIGHPWLWLQEVTISFFTYGIFIGAAAATRRNQHVLLSSAASKYTGKVRLFWEVFNRIVILAVAFCLIFYGYSNYLLGFGSFLMPSMTPIAVLYAAIPISGILISLFIIEQIVNGWKNGFDTQSFYEVQILEQVGSESDNKGVAG